MRLIKIILDHWVLISGLLLLIALTLHANIGHIVGYILTVLATLYNLSSTLYTA